MAEKTVIAYFKTREDADSVATKLKSMRVQDVSVSEFGRYTGEAMVGPGFPAGGGTNSLAALTLNTSVSSNDAGILLAAHPGASGQSSGETVSGHNYVLSAVVEEDIHHQALSVVEESGGYL